MGPRGSPSPAPPSATWTGPIVSPLWILRSPRFMLATSWSCQASSSAAITWVSIARAAMRPSVEKSAAGPTPSVFSAPSTAGFTAGGRGVGNEHPRERPHLHRQAVVARRLEPGVLLVGLEELVGGLRTRVLRLRLPVPRVPGPPSPSLYSYQEWVTDSVICLWSIGWTVERSRFRITPRGSQSRVGSPLVSVGIVAVGQVVADPGAESRPSPCRTGRWPGRRGGRPGRRTPWRSRGAGAGAPACRR